MDGKSQVSTEHKRDRGPVYFSRKPEKADLIAESKEVIIDKKGCKVQINSPMRIVWQSIVTVINVPNPELPIYRLRSPALDLLVRAHGRDKVQDIPRLSYCS